MGIECSGGKGDSQIVEGLLFIEHILRYFARRFLVYVHATLHPKFYYFCFTGVPRGTATYLMVTYLKMSNPNWNIQSVAFHITIRL